ncbi:hypothetical protein NEIELOOT_03010 [Neisseria elongata subsp. glycolytica ATCC 29315]|uniref:Uncharacterized protein n=1 Tax=Neisseria elongata subsp. glycolytica ATCC 29315 TaxID=546263 RepID=D4DV94_NEIEG|nr:hypothetical protein NEIELOOT_03010 [Neisseria elongata subsp. glycolytica ATCC 29315]
MIYSLLPCCLAYIRTHALENVDFRPDNIHTQVILADHSQGYSLTVALERPRKALMSKQSQPLPA